MRELTIGASAENLPDVLAFVEAALGEAGCPIRTMRQIDVAVEEIFVNIASYAYTPGSGEVTVGAAVNGQHDVSIVFSDGGVPYDPLSKKDPDVTLSADEREIGGLGVLMAKKLMDSVSYARRDGRNVLSLKKSW